MKHLLIPVFTLSLLLNGLLTKYSMLNGLAVHEILTLSGLGCLACTLLYSWFSKQSLVPKRILKQSARAAVAGLALYLLTKSYAHLNATSVSLIGRADLGILIVLGPMIKVPSLPVHRVLAVLIMLFTLLFLGIDSQTGDGWIGLALAFSGTIIITIGYLLIKESMKDENEAVGILTPALAVMAYGLGGSFLSDSALVTSLSFELLLCGIGLGCLMFFLYRLTFKMYRQFDIATAEYPTLIATGLMLPMEMYFFEVHFSLSYILAIVIFIVLAGMAVRFFVKEESK